MNIFIGTQNSDLIARAEKALRLLGDVVDSRVLVFAHIDSDIDKYDVVILHGTDTPQIVAMVTSARTFTECPIMVLTEDEASENFSQILDSGADDCMREPYLFDELHARLESLLRREQTTRFVTAELHIGDLSIDLQRHIVRSGGKMIPLTRTEYKFLCQLALNKDMVVSRSALGKHLPHANAPKLSHAVTMHIFNLRKKLYGHAQIDTISSQGFMIKQ